MTVLEFISSVISSAAWPIAAVAVALFLRKDISALVPRLRRVTASGVEFEAWGNDSSVVKGITFEEELFSEQPDFDSEDAKAMYARNLEEIGKIPEGERPQRLLNAVTIQQYEKAFALIYAEILGSQLEALEELNVRPLSRAEAEKMFEDLRQREPFHTGWSLDSYLGFLKRTNLISEIDGEYRLTRTGKDFLRFRTGAGLSLKRPL